MENKELKKELIGNGKAQQYRTTRRINIEQGGYNVFEVAMLDEEYSRIIFGMSCEETFECERIRRNAFQQTKKIKDHLSFLFQGNWSNFFMTFTFSDETLKNTSAKTRKDKITRLLKEFCIDYLINVDYGEENGREHYHAFISVYDAEKKMVAADQKGFVRFPFLDENYKYGFYSAEPIRMEEDDKSRLAKYITKLTLHSVKVRQSYVSCKKGSPYQAYKKLLEQRNRQGIAYGRAFTMDKDEFDEKETYLLSGFSTV